jgi:hypothetical protein
MGGMKTERLSYWLIVLTGYYAGVLVKMVLWVHRNGGFASPVRHMGTLTEVVLRSATVHAALLLGLMVVANLWQQRKDRNSTGASQIRQRAAV